MSAQVMEYWLNSHRNAIIYMFSLKPLEHNLLKGKPLSSKKGQAEAFFLIDDKGNMWILKKFHSARSPDRKYLSKISSLLPNNNGFACGKDRYVLSRGLLKRTFGCYYTRELDNWLEGTILMPRITGLDWANLADDIRDSNINLGELQRFTICKNLTKLITLLEANHCCHRDLSCGNVFIDIDTLDVYLIDFDSLYHPSLSMPKATTCGTVGYTSHLSWNNDRPDPAKTWCEYADRYALAILNAEFLLVTPGSKFTGEGGIFNEDELKKQRGSGINSIITKLRSKYPGAAQLLKTAINSSSFSDCPSPQQWSNLYNTVPGLVVTPPGLDEFPEIPTDYFANALRKSKIQPRIYPAPSLEEMKFEIPRIPKIWTPSTDIQTKPTNKFKINWRNFI